MFVILELLDLLALFPYLIYLFYLIHLIYTSGPQRFAFLREGPCVCVYTAIDMQKLLSSLKMRNRIQVNVSRYDKRFDITCHCDLIRCISQQGARGRIDGTGQRRPIYVVVKTYLHFRHGMWLTREPPSRFYFCFNLLNSISTSIC